MLPGFPLQHRLAYVVYGGPNGFPAVLDLSRLDGTNGFTITSSPGAMGGVFSSLSSGDVNGDGIDDLILGAPSDNGAIVIFGKKGGFGPKFDIGQLDGSNGFVMTGAITGMGSQAGAAVAAANVNGDNFSDIIVGAPGGAPANPGVVFIVYGRAGPWAPSLDLTQLNGANGSVINGLHNGDRLGQSSARLATSTATASLTSFWTRQVTAARATSRGITERAMLSSARQTASDPVST